MIVEAAIADGYGAAFEYVDPTPERPNDLAQYYEHPRHKIGEGRYTDDAESSTGILEAMLESGLEKLTPLMVAKHLVAAFHREKRRGYAHRFWDFLNVTKTGEEFLANIMPISDKSGAAMRGWTVGIYGTPKYVMEMAQLQAEVTHATEGGVQSAQAAALATHFFTYGYGKRLDLVNFVSAYVPGPWGKPRTEPVGPKGMDSVHAAIQAIMMHDSQSAILKQCVDFTGDVDTVACIAIGAASWSREIKRDLPQHLYDNLESGTWGTPYLVDLDKRVYEWLGRSP